VNWQAEESDLRAHDCSWRRDSDSAGAALGRRRDVRICGDDSGLQLKIGSEERLMLLLSGTAPLVSFSTTGLEPRMSFSHPAAALMDLTYPAANAQLAGGGGGGVIA